MGEPKVALDRESDCIHYKEDQEREDEESSLVTDMHAISPPRLWSHQHL